MSLIRRQRRGFPSESDFFDDFFGGEENFLSRRMPGSTPSVNVAESDHEFIIELAAPGMEKEDFSLSIDHNVLTISAERRDEKTDEQKSYTRREFSYSSFQRSFTLPDSADTDRVGAKYDNGILHITLPKREDTKKLPKREIKIS